MQFNIPTTERVREAYVRHEMETAKNAPSRQEAEAEFDRWVARLADAIAHEMRANGYRVHTEPVGEKKP